MAATIPTIEAHPVGVTTGEWCAACALPSAMTVTVAIVASRSLRIITHVHGTLCQDCGDLVVTR
jgi:hypothetical protein